jgi:hypothetical protein
MSQLHDTHILLWSEQQAKLLRLLAAGERVNAEIDWGIVIDEVEKRGQRAIARRLVIAATGVGSHAQSPGMAEQRRGPALAG